LLADRKVIHQSRRQHQIVRNDYLLNTLEYRVAGNVQRERRILAQDGRRVLETEAAAKTAVVREVVIHFGEVVAGRGGSPRKAGVVIKQPGRGRSREELLKRLRNGAETSAWDDIIRERLMSQRIVDRIAQLGKIPTSLL